MIIDDAPPPNPPVHAPYPSFLLWSLTLPSPLLPIVVTCHRRIDGRLMSLPPVARGHLNTEQELHCPWTTGYPIRILSPHPIQHTDGSISLETSAALPRDYEEFLFREPVVKRANAQINITRLWSSWAPMEIILECFPMDKTNGTAEIMHYAVTLGS